MEPVSNPLSVQEEAAPAKKRGVFLPSRFFSGKDKEAISQADENPGIVAAGLPPAGAVIPEPAAEPEPLVSKLAVANRPPPAVLTDHQSLPNMTPSEPTIQRPDNRRASAQLTIGFEITSLQLTPVFKLGRVQLRALSNVVSLHLLGAGSAETPLAAAVAFQIEHVDLDGGARLNSLLLKPLDGARELAAPQPRLQIDGVTLGSGNDLSPISIATAAQTSTPVQLFGTFSIVAMDFTPAFEIGSLRLELVSNTVLVRVTPSTGPIGQDLPPSFELAEVEASGDSTQIVGARLIPSVNKNA